MLRHHVWQQTNCPSPTISRIPWILSSVPDGRVMLQRLPSEKVKSHLLFIPLRKKLAEREKDIYFKSPILILNYSFKMRESVTLFFQPVWDFASVEASWLRSLSHGCQTLVKGLRIQNTNYTMSKCARKLEFVSDISNYELFLFGSIDSDVKSCLVTLLLSPLLFIWHHTRKNLHRPKFRLCFFLIID